MPGLYVFPGGTLEPWDADPGLPEDVWDEPLSRVLERMGRGLPVGQARAHLVAAIRETFEETGVLLASLEGEKETPRACILQGSLRRPKGECRRFKDLVMSPGIKLRASSLAAWAHWVTPEGLPKRFDTRFYVALHPAGQRCLPDEIETTQGTWIRPLHAILGNHDGRMPLSPPTLATLHELLQFPDLDSLIRKAWDRPWGSPRLPRAMRSPWGPMLLMPWDPQYSSQGPFETWASHHPEYAPPLEPFSRLVHRDGIWLPIKP